MLHSIRCYIRANYDVLLLPVAVLLAGTIGYRLIEDTSWLDSFYMTAITVSTVGFKEVREFTAAGKLFTIALIFAGLVTVAITASRIGQDMVSAAIQQRKVRMEQQLSRLRDHYIVCGFGRMGRVIARHLELAGTPFVVIDRTFPPPSEENAAKHFSLEGDATSDEVLERAGVRHARGLVSVLSRDSDNVFVVLSARELNPKLFILARANNEDTIPKLYRAGASKVINPYESAGARIAQTLIRPVVGDFMEVFSNARGLNVSIEEIEVQEDSPIADKPLRDSEIRHRTNAIVIAIQNPRLGTMRFNPSGEEIVQAGDILVAIAETEALNALADMARSPLKKAR